MRKYLLILVSLFSTVVSAQLPDKYVIVLIIDGARYSETLGDSLSKFIPRIKFLGNQGAILDSFINDGVTSTKRAVPAIWCGSWSQPKDTIIDGFNTQYALVPSVWEYFRKTHSLDQKQTFYLLKQLNGPWLPSFHPDYGESYWPTYLLQGEKDISVWQSAKYNLEKFHPRLSIIYLADVDSYGHSGNWQNYTNAIKIADSIAGMLWDFVQADSVFKNKTNLFITNDHGRHLDGISSGFIGHGDGCWGCRHIMFMAIGSDIKNGIQSKLKRTIPDVVPTIGKILNFPTPYASGKVISEIINEVSHVDQKVFSNSYQLYQNYPNPFGEATSSGNPSTAIRYQLSTSSHVTLKVYDVLGREVATLIDEIKDPGIHNNIFRILNSTLSSGIYYYQLRAGLFVETKKIVLIR